MITAPDYIQLYPTVRCNLSCGFCFNHGLPAMEDMSFEAFRELADRLKRLGVRTIDILGGEPTLLADLPRFLEYGVQQGLAITISSNGSDSAQLADIMHRFPGVQVGVSVNDQVTAERLAGFIRDRRPVVKTVPGSAPDEVLIDTLLSYRPKAFYLLYQDAMDRTQLARSVPFDFFLRTIRSRYDPCRVGTVYCSGFLPDLAQYPQLADTRCPAGTTKLGVLPDGSVYPCNLLFGRETYRLGNILSDPFESIWRHDALAFFRAFKGNRCARRTCDLHPSCRGGCPAHGIALSNDQHAPDPRCLNPNML